MPLPITEKPATTTVRLPYEIAAEDGRIFRDALVLSEAEYAVKSKVELTAEMQSRFAAWQAAITPPEKSELQTYEDALAEHLAARVALDALIAETQGHIARVKAEAGVEVKKLV